MSWEKVKEITDEDLSAGKIANLPNHPNRGAGFGEAGLTAQQLKDYFDKNVTLLRDTINNIIEEGDPDTLAEKISIFGNEKFSSLSELIAVINDEDGDGGFSDIIRVNVDGSTDVLNGFLGFLQKTKVTSVKGGSVKGAAYVVDENGYDKTLGYSSDAKPNTIVKRTESGDVLLPEGSSDERAAISRKDAAALLSEAVTKDAFEEEKIRTNTFVKSAKVEYDEANHVIRLTFTDGNGETDTSSVDLPLEMAFVGARLEEGNLVFTLQNGQEVSVPIGDVLGGLITSGALAQSLSGNEEDKAPSVKAVNDGLEGKLDALTNGDRNTTWLYGNSWDGKYQLFKASMHGNVGEIVTYGATSNTGASKPSGTIGVNMPEQPYQATPKQYVDDGLEGKFSLPTTLKPWSILGIGDYNAETGEYTPHLYQRDPVGCVNSAVATYASVTDESRWNKKYQNLKYTLGVPDPIYPIQVANKRYVDGKCQDLQQGVYNALGVKYITVEDTSTSDFSQIPEGAMPFAYFESLGDIVVYGHDGEVIDGGAEVVGIQLLGDVGEEISIDPNTVPTFFEIPNGHTTIMLNLRIQAAIDGLMSHFEIKGKKIIYQVKVGG